MWRDFWMYHDVPERFIVVLFFLFITVITAGIFLVAVVVGVALNLLDEKLYTALNRLRIDREVRNYKPSWEK